MLRCSLISLCIVFGAALTARADWFLTTAAFEPPQKITINEWSLTDGLSYGDANAALHQMPTRQMVSLTNDKPIPAPNSEAAWKITLRNGDILLGAPAAMHDQNMTLTTLDFGVIEIPLKAVACIEAPHQISTTPPAAHDQDTVTLHNGDTVSGFLNTISETKLDIQTDADTVPITLDKVVRITMGGAVPPRAIPALSARVIFPSGESLATTSAQWKLDDLIIHDPAGIERTIPLNAIAAVNVLGGRVIYLSELDPSSDSQISSFGAAYPTQINRSVMGTPLMIGGTTYSNGLGVHLASTLTYALDGTFTTLVITPGMQSSAAPFGSAHATIKADDTALWDAPIITAATPATALTLPLHNAHTLQLLAQPVDHFDVQGRFDWVNAALIRQ
jgi:hypothetical protein